MCAHVSERPIDRLWTSAKVVFHPRRGPLFFNTRATTAIKRAKDKL
jgi:hypothetical protein